MASLTYWLWLTGLRGLKNQTRLALLRQFGSPEAVYFADREELLLTEGMTREQADRLEDHSLEGAERVLGECDRLDIDLVTMQDAAYPGRLRDIYDPPCLLYVKGRLPVLDEAAVIAVVGTRSCTPYGITWAERFGYGLASGGCVIASGMALGIDAAAIRGALLAGGIPLGFLGNGLDVVYPREHRALYADVAAAGALISEYPPGTRPLSGNFPIRNRILSGVSVGALVVEAPRASGALITASLAADQGRDVFAVPGPIGAYASQGCNLLIQEGAALVTDPRNILEVYAARFALSASRPLPEVLAPPEPVPEPDPAPEPPEEASDGASEGTLPVLLSTDTTLSDDQLAMLRLLDPETPRQTDDLLEAAGIPVRRALSALTVLEIDGRVLRHEGGRYTRTVDLREVE